MIALTTEAGVPLRYFDPSVSDGISWHRAHGFVTARTVTARRVVRRRGQEITARTNQQVCAFAFRDGIPTPLSACRIEAVAGGSWRLRTDVGPFLLKPAADVTAAPVADTEDVFGRRMMMVCSAIMVGLIGIGISGALKTQLFLDPMQALEAQQKSVVIPAVKSKPPPPPPPVEEKKPEAVVQKPTKKPATAVANKLGFLALLGRADLKKAVGGLPSVAERRSAGAGAGDQGSGGQLLSGLGQGVKHTTVGNTGVAGLGGIGKAGAGGGEGGFGRSYVGSGGAGGGKSLADVHLAKDVELDGGLDRAVIQATIAKYLSQVRACYERGLSVKPGLAGQVTMNFEIAASGKLSFANVKTSTLDHTPTENCIAHAMLSWQFPKPVGGTLTNVNYPFMLKPSSYM